jgi:hypothetical protein
MSLQSVQLSLVLFGAVCIIAAIVGGNIKLPGVQVGPIASEDAREGLGILGFALLGASYFLPQWYSTGPTKEAYAHKLNNLCHQVSEAFPNPPQGYQENLAYLNREINMYHQIVAEVGKIPAPEAVNRWSQQQRALSMTKSMKWRN